jgi:hypothetical protein
LSGAELNHFSSFQIVQEVGIFAVDLDEGIARWESVSHQIDKIPFFAIDIDQFRRELSELKEHVTLLQDNTKLNYPILGELVARVTEIYPFLEELEMLAKGKMQDRH